MFITINNQKFDLSTLFSLNLPDATRYSALVDGKQADFYISPWENGVMVYVDEEMFDGPFCEGDDLGEWLLCPIAGVLFKESEFKTHERSDIGKFMAAKRCSFDAAFWLKTRSQLSYQHILHKGNLYLAYEGVKAWDGSLGYGGQKFDIDPFYGDFYVTNDLWCIGKVPEWIKDDFKNHIGKICIYNTQIEL